MLLQVQLTLLQKNFEGGGHWPPWSPPQIRPWSMWRDCMVIRHVLGMLGRGLKKIAIRVTGLCKYELALSL